MMLRSAYPLRERLDSQRLARPQSADLHRSPSRAREPLVQVIAETMALGFPIRRCTRPAARSSVPGPRRSSGTSPRERRGAIDDLAGQGAAPSGHPAQARPSIPSESGRSRPGADAVRRSRSLGTQGPRPLAAAQRGLTQVGWPPFLLPAASSAPARPTSPCGTGGAVSRPGCPSAATTR